MSGCQCGYGSGCGNHGSQPLGVDSKWTCAGTSSADGASRRNRRTSRYRRRDGVRRPGTRKLEEILLTVHRYRMVDREIIQLLHFTPAGKSAAQRALTNLWWSKHLDKLPGRPLNAKDVYMVSGRARRGMRVLEGLVGRDEARSRLQRFPAVEHALAVNHFRARVELSAKKHSMTVVRWDDELDLAQLAKEHIVPDAFFVLGRMVDGRERQAGFMLEMEIAPVSRTHWRRRLESYAQFYYSGTYRDQFGLSSLRLLVQVSTGGGHLRSITEEAERVGFTPIRVASSKAIAACPDLLASDVWWSPSGNQRLYGPDATESVGDAFAAASAPAYSSRDVRHCPDQDCSHPRR